MCTPTHRCTHTQTHTYHGVVAHVAGFADRLVLLHDVGLPGQHAVAVKATEVLQVPVLILGLCVLVTEDQLYMHDHNTPKHTHKNTQGNTKHRNAYKYTGKHTHGDTNKRHIKIHRGNKHKGKESNNDGSP